MIELVKPSEEYKESFIEAMREFQSEGQERYMKLNLSELESDFEQFLGEIDDREKGINLLEGRVPSSEFWVLDGNEFIGGVYIRHKLNETLLKKGGHIGYHMRPTKRKMGYGTQALRLALPIAKNLGIQRVLITCDDDNLGSMKIIEKNGGILENKIEHEGKFKRRYWIDNK